mmetsp:Transcript_17422/g.29264  ORF Transcript_17422/g.29264 Transcript_17422/m.29264 type:complete len:430 (+) Transcript_17422:192-1481(+)|eukprot:CAMPEP_0198199810 /NCGR_PEP_ID=MMETSP1445-20131203/2964_1 /TAXON_ID=36898 /ORGANISM="Pyramimonas sp., Strain CCMP2087" /LENGTH=429 /DNA_ID=CAMNT_0043869709 /DNA_START=154 /DNA_END=1443 /DNA_ORIENTATION=+
MGTSVAWVLLSVLLLSGGTQMTGARKQKREDPPPDKHPKRAWEDPAPAEPAKAAIVQTPVMGKTSGMGGLEEYQRFMAGAFMYFRTRGLWNEKADLVKPDNENKECQKEKFPEGCISKDKIVAFLHDKWVPGFESSTDPHFIEPGGFFKAHRGLAKADRKTIAVAEGALRHKLIEEMGDKKQAKFEQANGLPRDKNGKLPGDYVEHTGPVVESTRFLVSKLANYLLSRPVEAIPVAARPFFMGPNEGWPGSHVSRGREPFLPPADQRQDVCASAEVAGGPQTCRPWREQDVDPPALSSQQTELEEHEEEGSLADSALFRQIFYLAMALMGILTPSTIAYFCLRTYLTTKAEFPLTMDSAEQLRQHQHGSFHHANLVKKYVGRYGTGLVEMSAADHNKVVDRLRDFPKGRELGQQPKLWKDFYSNPNKIG